MIEIIVMSEHDISHLPRNKTDYAIHNSHYYFYGVIFLWIFLQDHKILPFRLQIFPTVIVGYQVFPLSKTVEV